MDNDKFIHHLKGIVEFLKAETAASAATAAASAVKEVQNSSLGQSHEDQYLTIQEVCSLFKISKSQVHNLRKEHKDFPFTKIGNNVRYKQSELEAFFKSLKQRP
ncbi:MAG TPA: helix-turn-helix domain-containing protein [Salinimicrobium sp.]|nr:helix-turn-helix domain-containing protein [Salinimicrobium sp.]